MKLTLSMMVIEIQSSPFHVFIVFPPSIPSISKYFNLRTMDGVVNKEKRNPKEPSPSKSPETREPSPRLSPEPRSSSRVSPSLRQPQQEDIMDYETQRASPKLTRGKSSEYSPKRPSSRLGTARPPSSNRLSNPESKKVKTEKKATHSKQKSQEKLAPKKLIKPQKSNPPVEEGNETYL